MLRTFTLCCLLALPPLGGLCGCAADRQALRKDPDETADLGQRAELFWQSIRWGDMATAAEFVGAGEKRLHYQQWLEDQRTVKRYSDVHILRVALDEPLAEAEAAEDGTRILRRATVVVRTEGYRLPAQVIEEETLSQAWIRTDEGWLLEWSDG